MCRLQATALCAKVIFHLEIGWIPFSAGTPRCRHTCFTALNCLNCGHSVSICFDAHPTSWSSNKWPWMRIYHRPNYTKGSKMSYDVTNHQQLYHYLCVARPLSCTRRSVTSSAAENDKQIYTSPHEIVSVWQRENKTSRSDARCSQCTVHAKHTHSHTHWLQLHWQCK